MMGQKRGDIPYLLGLLFFITAVIYFFASNWPLFNRPAKLALSLAVLLFCAGAAFFYKRSSFFSYLGNWWLFLSVIAFGTAVALIGQMYNSHADSYMLFFLTLVPAVFLAWHTNYRPLYWLCFFLFEMALWLKLYPSGTFLTYTTGEELLLYGGLTALHVIIYLFWLNIHEQKLSFLSLILAQYCVTYLLFSHALVDLMTEDIEYAFVFMFLHGLYIALMILLWKLFMKKRKQHPFELGIHLLFFGIYIVWNGVYFWFTIMGEYIFYAGFPMLFILFALSIFILKKLKAQAETENRKWIRYTVWLFTGVLAFIGTLLAVLSLSSFIAFFFGLSGDLSNSFIFLAALCIGAGIAIRKESWLVVQMTLQITGLVFAFSFIAFHSESAWPAFAVAVPAVFLTALLFQKKEAVFYYLAANGAFLWGIIQWLSEKDFGLSFITWTLFGGAAVNAGLFLRLKQHPVGLAACWLSLALGLCSLTEERWDSFFLHILFLLYLCRHLFSPALETRFYRWPIWMALIGFILWKYYEYAWLLLHKSIAFLIVSAVFFFVWFVWGRKHTVPVEVKTWSTGIFAAVIAVQSLFLLGVSWQKEQLLQHGKIVALELAPIDPRSILQGDYVQLNYEVQRIYSDLYFNEPVALPDGTLDVVLVKSAGAISYNGKTIPVYTASQFVSDGSGLTMKGKAHAETLTLGIEHFFIPENTGVEWEEKTHAIVRVSRNGDAILETLR